MRSGVQMRVKSGDQDEVDRGEARRGDEGHQGKRVRNGDKAEAESERVRRVEERR